MTGSSKFWTWALTGFLTLGIVVFFNFFIDVFGGQWDLTEDDRYTLPPAAATIAGRLEDVCTVKCYVSSKLPSMLNHVPRALRTRLEEFRTASQDRLEFQFIDPGEEGEEFREELQGRGVQPLPLTTLEGGKRVEGSYYMSLELAYLDREERLDLVRALSQAILYESEMLRGLPYALSAKLVKLMNPQPSVGIVSEKKIPPKELQTPQGPFPAEASDGLTGLRQAVETNLAKPADVNVSTGTAIPEDYEAIIVYRPDGLSERSVFEIDQALMRGQNVAVVLDNHATVEVDRFMKDYWPAVNSPQSNGRIRVREIDSGMTDWLAHFGINLGKGYLETLQCGVRVLNQLKFMPGRGMVAVPQQIRAPAVVIATERDKEGKTGQFSDDDPAFSGIGQVSVFAPAPLTLDASVLDKNHSGATQEAVVSTSADTYVREAKGGWLPIWEQSASDTPTDRRAYPLVVSVRGSFKSYFAGKTFGKEGDRDRPPLLGPDGSERPAGPAEQPKLDESVEPGQLWVFADADFCNDLYLMQRFGLAGKTQVVQAMQGATRMTHGLLNVVNNLTAGKELVEIRKPSLTDRKIDSERIDDDRWGIRFKAVWLMPIIVVGFGLAWWILRSVMTHVPSPSIDAGHAGFKSMDAPAPATVPDTQLEDVTTEEKKPEERQS